MKLKRLLLTLGLATVLCMGGGCTKYVIEKTDPATGVITKVSISSTRDLEEPEAVYERKGQDVKFGFKAANVDNNTEAMMGMFEGMMAMMNTMMMKMMALQTDMLLLQGATQ